MKKIIVIIFLVSGFGTQAQKKDSVNIDTLHFISLADINRVFFQNSDKMTFKDGQTFLQIFNSIYAELLKERESKK